MKCCNCITNCDELDSFQEAKNKTHRKSQNSCAAFHFPHRKVPERATHWPTITTTGKKQKKKMAIVVKFGKKKTFTRSLIVFIFIRSCYITGLVRHSKGTKREGEDVIFYPKLQPNCRLLLALIRGKLTEETCHPSISAKFSYRKV